MNDAFEEAKVVRVITNLECRMWKGRSVAINLYIVHNSIVCPRCLLLHRHTSFTFFVLGFRWNWILCSFSVSLAQESSLYELRCCLFSFLQNNNRGCNITWYITFFLSCIDFGNWQMYITSKKIMKVVDF